MTTTLENGNTAIGCSQERPNIPDNVAVAHGVPFEIIRKFLEDTKAPRRPARTRPSREDSSLWEATSDELSAEIGWE